MGVFPGPERRALDRAGRAFRSGNGALAEAGLDLWVTRSAVAAREDLALRFLDQDYEGVLALARAVPAAAGDDEARLWVARGDADLAHWADCLADLGKLATPSRPWALCLRAEALSALKDPSAAAVCAEALSAAAGTRLGAMAALDAAEEAASRDDDADAERLYKRAKRADPSYTLVDGRLAEIYLCQGRWSEARSALERERAVDPRAEAPQVELKALLSQRMDQSDARGSERDARLRSFAGRDNPCVVPLALLAGEPRVRVGVLAGAESAVLRMGGAMVDDASGLTLPPDSVWVACAQGKGVWTLAPVDPSFGPARECSGPLRLRPVDPACTFGLFDVSHGSGYFFAGRGDRYYRGLLEISDRPEGLLVVDELGLEAYLCSVVPSEIPASWPVETLGAQAIAARTAAWASLGRYRRRGYDLCPSVACAAFSGVGVERPRTDAAIAATAGVVLEDPSGKLALVHYMDNSGGHTLAAAEVWQGPAPDSIGVADCPADAYTTRALFPLSAAGLLHYIDDLDNSVQGWSRREGGATWRWTLRLTPEELAPSVGRMGDIGRLRTVLGLGRSAGGYLESARVVGDLGAFTVSGDRIRTALKGLKSDLFYVEPRFDAQGRTVALLFHGGGWGHGVGLSQSGAEAMARAGLDDHAILRHYFPGDKICRRYPRRAGGAMQGAAVNRKSGF